MLNGAGTQTFGTQALALTVRVIDVFANELELRKLGFDRAEPSATGRPAYHLATLLKIFIYGYGEQSQSTAGTPRPRNPERCG